ncbi:ABC transporter ATP-binding protein [Spirochaeta lutea]|uniref:ABC transporter domain-containing protein n=1 Tax=Spirochaeta lutea TaxID=1480694 RepID=A0A098QTL4_9SPIO|nr:ABC transporter ATP-binding protein [Spirochaeta lutea]KGE70738.1 hypothetical protein DC28_14650 [Spirochaeta lutea]
MESSTIDLIQVQKEYRNGSETLEVIREVSLSISPGIVVITGESGSGKSTLLNLLGGMDRPSRGRVMVAGVEVSRLSETELGPFRTSTVGFIFQFHHLLRDFTALENVMLPCYMARGDKRGALDRARELLERVGVAHRMNAFPGQMSGGERQRTAVARALVNNPQVVLADEPTGNLDEYHSREVEELLFSLARDLGKTLVLVTHNPKLAGFGDLHLELSKGVIRQEVP